MPIEKTQKKQNHRAYLRVEFISKNRANYRLYLKFPQYGRAAAARYRARRCLISVRAGYDYNVAGVAKRGVCHNCGHAANFVRTFAVVAFIAFYRAGRLAAEPLGV